MSAQRISVVLPVFNERENIAACLRGLWSALREHDHEILVCYDFDEDSTLPAIAAMADRPLTVRLVKNSIGRGAAFAIRAGFAAAQGDVVVTTMADLCDPPEVIPRMAEKIRLESADVVAGSRYMRGGSQSGGPWLKRTISRWVGYSMWWIAGLGTHDATTNFRAYSKRFLDAVTVESKTSFDIALELTVKAQLSGRKVSEVPSSWIDRTAGESRFRMWKWMPNYLRWYVGAMAAPVLVLGVWLAMFLGAGLFVWQRGSPVPLMDDVEMVVALSPEFSHGAQWLWSAHNEHRIPLARLAFEGTLSLLNDIRAVMSLEVILLGSIALLMILAARRLRGRTSYADVFFPFLWLHTGNAENLLMAFQISLMLPVSLVALILIRIASGARVPSPKDALAIGIALLLLPLNGGHGLTQALPLVVWLGAAGLVLARSRPGAARPPTGAARRSGRVMLAFAAATALLVGSYFIGWESPSNVQYAHDVLAMPLTVGQFLSTSLGPAGQTLWPWSLWFVLVLCALTVLLLVRVWFRDRDERIRAAGLLACMASVVTMGFAAAWGRGYSNEVAGFATRYVMLPASILCACWFAWSRYAWAPIAACVQFALAFTLCVALPINASAGNDFAVSRGRVAVSLERDVNAGIPIRELSHIYADSVYPGAPDLDARLRVLDRMHFAPFTNRPSEADPVMTQLDQVMAAMRRPPAGMRSARPIVTTTVDGVPVIVVRPPGELRFDPVPDRRAVRGRFGMLPASWAVEGNASVTFTVERIAYAGERRVLFERTLDPVRNAGDRGLQIFHVALPDDAIGQIVLRTSLPPDANPMIAWSYWAEMRFEEMPVDSDGR